MTDQMEALVSALRQLPPFSGITWRAASFELTSPFTVDVPIPTTNVHSLVA